MQPRDRRVGRRRVGRETRARLSRDPEETEAGRRLRPRSRARRGSRAALRLHARSTLRTRCSAACEAVSIAVPTVEHRAAVERAAAAGRHALVEKPMAATVAEADAMVEAARRAGTRLQVGHVERFNPALLAARSHIHAPKFIECHRLARVPAALARHRRGVRSHDPRHRRRARTWWAPRRRASRRSAWRCCPRTRTSRTRGWSFRTAASRT